MTGSSLSYSERANYCTSSVAKKLLTLMDQKETNLAFSADVTSAQELLALAELLGSEICLLKTHIDIISDFTPDLTAKLQQLAKQYEFLIFEDRKFADIGHTVQLQYAGGSYRIADWADLVNAHTLPGPGIIQGLAEVGLKKNRALVLLSEMSSKGHLMSAEYQQQTLKMAASHPDFVIGFITQHALCNEPQWIHFTPGIQLEMKGDTLGQQYTTPEKAIIEQGTDVIIVGRGIFSHPDPLAQTKKYRHCGWECYKKRCKQ